MNIDQRLKQLESRAVQRDEPIVPIVLSVEDCSENPETFEIIGINAGQGTETLSRLNDESTDDLVERWMSAFYSEENRHQHVVPVLWCVYSREPLPAGEMRVTTPGATTVTRGSI